MRILCDFSSYTLFSSRRHVAFQAHIFDSCLGPQLWEYFGSLVGVLGAGVLVPTLEVLPVQAPVYLRCRSNTYADCLLGLTGVQKALPNG